jgi:UDPglucose--hexose-1-phosphate uridylyltransferase
VAVAPGRSSRPGAGAAELEPVTDEQLASCPFCEGREDRTPPELLALPRDRAPDTPGWQVRVVPNKYPAFEHQEVVVNAPRHVRSIAELDLEQLELVAEAWRLRAEAAREAGKVLFAGVNEGHSAGASLQHSHSQLVWLDAEPPIAQAERGPGCPLCELLEVELADGARVVEQRDGLVLLCPYAGRSPYECLIAPLEHEADGYGPRLGAGLDLAAEALRRLADDAPRPMNLWLHESGHWHLELLPRLTVFAALELGAGYFVNTIPPEEAAAQLRR